MSEPIQNILRVVPWEVDDGRAHMAADEALLVRATETGVAALRFYSWCDATVSLGYFQPAQERLPGLPFVRRNSGGTMLVHHHELTYALALPPGATWQPRGESWLCRMHHLIQDVLLHDGKETEVVVCGREQKLGDGLCFLNQTPGDVVVQGHKIVGSAQFKKRGGLLQHGGILLARSEHAPELPGIHELLGLSLDPQELSTRITQAFATKFACEITVQPWSDDERLLREQFLRDKYDTEEWNMKR